MLEFLCFFELKIRHWLMQKVFLRIYFTGNSTKLMSALT